MLTTTLADRYVDPRKRYADRVHARRRAAERYGLSLTDGDLDSIALDIALRRPNTAFLRPDKKVLGRLWVAVYRDSRWLATIFDQITSTVVTFLPPWEIDGYREGLRRREDQYAGRAFDPASGPPVGTVLGMVAIDPMVGFPAYAPPVATPRTVGEARARVAEIEVILLDGWDRLRRLRRCCRTRDVAREYDGLKAEFKAEKTALKAAINEAKTAAVRARDFGPIEDRPLAGAGTI